MSVLSSTAMGGLGLSTRTGIASDGFPSPWTDYASTEMPETMQLALRYCEYIFCAQATYRQATDRILSYFITDLDYSGASDDKKDKWKEVFEKTFDYRNMLHTVGLDALCYGNSFTSVMPGFKRHLSCGKCYFELPLAEVYNNPVFRFRWANYEWQATCPKCHTSGRWQHIDRRTHLDKGFRIKRWNPHEMEILWDPITDETGYIWKIPEDYRKMIREGHLFHLERAPWEVIQAIKHNNYLLFDKDVIYHMREDALAGLRNRGWGISRVISNFRQAYYVQLLHRYNEAIALDYVIPFRVITPVAGDKSAGSDPMFNYDLGDMSSQVMRMINGRRRDPAQWNFLPFEVKYQALGGDATKLAPKELLDQGIDTLLNAIGTPAEMYKGSLTMQSAPAALRLFEATHVSIPHNLNGWLRFVTKQVAQIMNWEMIEARLMKVTHADDVQRQMAKLQLMMGGQISKTTGLKSVGIEHDDEVKRQLEDERYEAEEQAKLQEEMDHASQMEQMSQPQQQGAGGAGGAPGGAPAGGGGAPAGGGGGAGGAGAGAGPMGAAQQSVAASLPTGPNQKITPEELQSRAQYVASQIMGMPESQKDSELMKLKQVDPTLHAIVRQVMDQYRQQAKTQGGSQMLAQQFGKQSSIAPQGIDQVLLGELCRQTVWNFIKTSSIALPSPTETIKIARAPGSILGVRRRIRT